MVDLNPPSSSLNDGNPNLISLLVFYKAQRTSAASHNQNRTPTQTSPAQNGNSPVHKLSQSYRLQHIGFMSRSGVREVINATTLILAERTNPEEMNIINEDEKEIMKEYSCVCYLSSDNLGAILLMKRSYPHNSAKIVIHQVMNDVRAQIGSDLIKLQNPLSRPSVRLNLDLTDYLVKYHNPGEFDELQQTQELLNGVKAQIVENIQEVMKRDEKFEDLLNRSEQLGVVTRQFTQTSAMTKKCC